MGCVAGKNLWQSRSAKVVKSTDELKSRDGNLYPTPTEWPEESDVPTVPHQGEEIDVKISSVYDADTCTILVPFGTEYVKYKLRILGVDAPEIRARRDRSKDSELTEEEIERLEELVALEKRAAIVARDAVRDMIHDKVLKVRLVRHDKYGGRVLGSLIIPKGYGERILKDYLLRERLAKEYTGGKKEAWTKEELTDIISRGE